MPRRSLILCVDDEWNGLEGRKTRFEETGCKVLVATGGAEALQLFASHPVDLVLLDYHMPGMNGDVVAEQMKAGQPDVPIALLSADDEPPEHALRWVDAFVSKSESPANLLQIVLSGHPKTGQWWSGQNRPTGRGRGLSCFILPPPVVASLFSYANSGDHI